MPARIDLNQVATTAQKLGLITPSQLARMTDGTVSWRDKAAAERAVTQAATRGGLGGTLLGAVAKDLQQAVTQQYEKQNPIATGAEALREGPSVIGRRIENLWNKVF
jgi:hypothetical protein